MQVVTVTDIFFFRNMYLRFQLIIIIIIIVTVRRFVLFNFANFLNFCCEWYEGHAVAQLEVAGSIPDYVIGIFY